MDINENNNGGEIVASAEGGGAVVRNPRSRTLDKTSKIFICLSHFLSSFGDRVWHFAVGLYLYHLHPCSLMLTAIYGLSTCGALFLLGAPVGRWVDKSKRLSAARITIVVQNAAVVISGAIMATAIFYKQEIAPIWDGKLEIILYTTIITVEVIAELASMANKLVLEKDWIVVLAGGDKKKLSYLNSAMRTINLSCKIIAPFVVGHLLEWVSYSTGAIFIASWNIVSAFVEFYLLRIIFALVPELSKGKSNNSSSQSTCSVAINRTEPQSVSNLQALENQEKMQPETLPTNEKPHTACCMEGVGGPGKGNDNNNNNNRQQLGIDFKDVSLITPPKLSRANSAEHNAGKICARAEANGEGESMQAKEKDDTIKRCICDGWRVYFSHPVKYAGLGLSSLYMTILCFDNISIGYLSSQGVSARMSGNVTAVAAIIGILGSMSFPYVRNKIGKNKAGIVGFGLETACLLLCVVSIVSPGSPFDPSAIWRLFDRKESSCRDKNVVATSLSLSEHWEKHSDIFWLVTGITLARYGLWIADLSVTQIFQEKVHESQRGVMGGVQSSFNQLLSLVKACLTILLPYPEQFGYLICLSWIFVLLGSIFFMIFVVEDEKEAKAKKTRQGRMVSEQPR